ncbi:Tyrosine-protein kinase YwqD [Crateriforma conspicua]|nr:Tyrosine-protein kinase YwqD [Crateriforma conspicua]
MNRQFSVLSPPSERTPSCGGILYYFNEIRMSTNELSNRPYSNSPAMMQAPIAMMDRDGADGGKNEMPNIGAAMWRYRWAVALPTMLGMVAGFLLFLRTNETFRATTQIMIESNRPAVMDTMTGEMVGGVPSIEIVQAQLFSDEVIRGAFENPEMIQYHETLDEGDGPWARFVEMVKKDEVLELEPEVSDVKTAQSVVALLHFDSPNPDLSTAAVTAFSQSLQQYYNKKYSNSRDELKRFINEATDKVQPQLDKYESIYAQFRKESDLFFDEQGNAINPHRVRVQELMADRGKLVQEYVDSELTYRSIKQTVEGAEDPRLAFTIVSQLLDRPLSLPKELDATRLAMGADDGELASMEVQEELAPLKADRDALAAELGKGHPHVKVLDNKIASLEKALDRLGQSRSSRIGQLMDDEERKTKQALQAIDAVQATAKTKVDMLKQRLDLLTKEIESEAAKGRLLADKEVDYIALQNKIEGTRELVTQVSESMARVDMSTSTESETRVVELIAAKGAYLVAPILWKLVGIGGFLGLALGAGMAFLLEKNANTFRDPDEIAASLGTSVLTHVPFFKKRLTKRGSGQNADKDSPYKELDPCLAVLHSPSSVAAESVRSLRTATYFELAGVQGGKILQVTSPLPGDGKSTIAGNLACAIAQSGKSVLAIDCDLRRPQLTDNFVMQDQLGLTNVLNGECEWQEACHTTPLGHLDVMPSGPIPANPAEALTLPEMAEMLEQLREHYDYVIVDTPPLLVVTDPSILASLVDGVLLTLRVRRKSKLNAREAVNILNSVGGNLIGTVINNSDEASSSDGYRGYGYYRYSRYAKKYYRRGGNAGEVVPKGSKKRSGMVVSGRSTQNRVRPSEAMPPQNEAVAAAAPVTRPSVPSDHQADS